MSRVFCWIGRARFDVGSGGWFDDGRSTSMSGWSLRVDWCGGILRTREVCPNRSASTLTISQCTGPVCFAGLPDTGRFALHCCRPRRPSRSSTKDWPFCVRLLGGTTNYCAMITRYATAGFRGHGCVLIEGPISTYPPARPARAPAADLPRSAPGTVAARSDRRAPSAAATSRRRPRCAGRSAQTPA